MKAWLSGYAIGSAVLMAVILAAPSAVAVQVAGVLTGVLSAAATIGGIVRHRPAKAWIWWVLVVGLLFTSMPRTVSITSSAVGPPVMVISALGNLCFLAVPLLLVRARGGKDRDESLDGWILTLALAVALRQFLLAGQPEHAVVPQPVVLTLTVMAGVTVAASIRLVFLDGRSVSVWLLMAGSLAGQLIGVSLAMANSGIGTAVVSADVLAGVSHLLTGAAGMVAGMTALTVPVVRRGTLPYARLILIGIALPAAVVAVFVEAGGDRLRSFAGLGVFAIVVLLMLRMGRLVTERERLRRLQALVADLGARALADDDEHRLLHRITATLREELGADVAAVALPAAQGGVLRLAAAEGWPEPTPVQVPYAVLLSADESPLGWVGATLRVPLAGEGGVLLLHRDRHRRPFSLDERIIVEAVAVTVSSALRRYRSEAQVRHASLHDPLTGLPNRTLLLRRLGELVAVEPAGSVGLLFVDLDRFKSVNDTLGHRAGDELLVAAVVRIRSILRPDYLLARLAGDEFVVLCHNLTRASAADAVSARITATLAEPFVLDAGVAQIGGSVGVAVHDGRETPEQLLHRADTAMYQRKQAVPRP